MLLSALLSFFVMWSQAKCCHARWCTPYHCLPSTHCMTAPHVAQRKFSPAASCPPVCGPGTAWRAAGTPGSQLQGWKPASVLHRDTASHTQCATVTEETKPTQPHPTERGLGTTFSRHFWSQRWDLGIRYYCLGNPILLNICTATAMTHTCNLTHPASCCCWKKAFCNTSLAVALTRTLPWISSTHELKRKLLFSAGLVNCL